MYEISVLRTFKNHSYTTHHTPLIIHHSSIHHSSYTTHQCTTFKNHSYTTHHKAQHFVNLDVQIAWQAKYFVNLHVQIS